MRDLILTAVFMGILPFSAVRPWVGVLLWSWIGYMNPHRLTWGFATEVPWALVAGVVTLIGIPFARDRKPIPWVRETYLLAALWVMFTITTVFSLYPEEAWPQWERVSKILLFVFITMKFFQDRDRLRYLFILIAFSIGFYGVKGFVFSIMTGGQHLVYGPMRSFLSSNNSVGLAINMILPFLYMLRRDEPRRWLRLVMIGSFWASAGAIIFTYSRGAFLGLAVVMTLLFLRGSKRLVAGGVGFVVVAIFFLTIGASLIPEAWWARMGTISTYQEDRSAMGRLEAWRIAYELALDRPLIGGGFWVLPHEEIRELYGAEGAVISAHSIYFAILGDHGFVALGLYVGLLASCLLSLRRLRRTVGLTPEGAWVVNPAKMLEISLVAYMICGAFQTEAYFDLFYHLVAAVVMLKVLATRPEPVAASEPAPSAIAVPVAAAPLVGRRRPLPGTRLSGGEASR
ncbi:MAG TPA: putative O-glycosylation ligase, exosortase A system-associated [Methylomirabilota bacterium]|nr:putative O-glycosylation ligase, exosortase A system-associated [Methylomirabilota bacterium]